MTKLVMTAAAGQRVRLDVRLASGDVLEAGHHAGGDDGRDDYGHHRPYANRRSIPVHFPCLRSRDRILTKSPHEAQSPDLRQLERHLERARRIWSGCKGHRDLGIGDTPPLVYPSVCLWSHELTVVMYFGDHEA
jgi:hypothetical protein